MKIPVVANLR